MKRHNRKRRALVWIGFGLCVVLGAMWVDRQVLPIRYILQIPMLADYRVLKSILTPPLMMLIPVALTAFWFWRLDRQPEGRCMNCGYNLTGNVSGVCPECGTAI